MRVAWTGHRPEFFADPRAAEAEVHRLAAELLAEYGPDLRFLVGGQRGVDTWAAEAAMRLGVPFELYLPMPEPEFTRDWTPEDRARLAATRRAAASVVVVDTSGRTGPAAYSARNRALAEGGDLVVAVWTGRPGGGTWETVQLARSLGKPVRETLLPGSGYAPRPGERGL